MSGDNERERLCPLLAWLEEVEEHTLAVRYGKSAARSISAEDVLRIKEWRRQQK